MIDLLFNYTHVQLKKEYQTLLNAIQKRLEKGETDFGKGNKKKASSACSKVVKDAMMEKGGRRQEMSEV